MIVMPLVELDRYLIRKGYGVFNIHDFINAMLGADSVEEGYSQLQQNHHDLSHENFAGVEADAVQLAFQMQMGGLTEQDKEIIDQNGHPGQKGDFNQSSQLWFQTFQKAVNIGAPLVNEAISKTNAINRKRAAEAGHPPPIDLPMAFVQDNGNYVAVPAWRSAVQGYKEDGTHNRQGALITQRLSRLTHKPEAYARPYNIGLETLRSEKYPNVKFKDKFMDEVFPNILHGDSLYIRDDNLRNDFAFAVQSVKQKYPYLPFEQLQGMALQSLRSLPQFNKFAGIRHGDGLKYGTHSEEAVNQMQVEQRQENANSYDELLNFIHPDMREHASFRLTGNQAYHTATPSRKMKRLFEQHHGWDEETTNNVYQNAYSGKFSHLKNSRDKLMAAVREQEMLDGKPPQWAGDAIMPQGASIGSPVDEQPSPQMEERPPVQEAIATPPPYPVRPDPEPPKMNQHMSGATPIPVASPASPPPQMQPQNRPQPPMQPLNAYPSTSPAVQNTGRGVLNNLMTRLGYAYESLFPSFGKTDMSNEEVLTEMLENVQLEIAKKEVVQTIFTKSHQSISSIADVSTIANRINRPNSDIVSIYHSRGDWENVAKTFGMTHKEVQMVKVIFNE